MDTQRLILFLVFSFSMLLLVEAWMKGSAPQQQPAARTSVVVPSTASTSLPATSSAPSLGAGPVKGEVVRVETDTLIAEIDTVGATLRRLELKQHRSAEDKSKNFVLFENEAGKTYLAQSGLLGEGRPNHQTPYVASGKDFRLTQGQDKITVDFVAPAGGGLGVAKHYEFHRGAYEIGVRYTLRNETDRPVQTDIYYQLLRHGNDAAGVSSLAPTYTGGAFYTEKEKFRKVSFKDIDKQKNEVLGQAEDGWVAMIQHYFLGAWLFPEKVRREYYAKQAGENLYAVGAILSGPNLAPGESREIRASLYGGPQQQDKLAQLAPGLNLTVDYGWLTIVASPLFWALSAINKISGNWGTSIIILTVIIKLIFFPLSAASYRSMAKMRVVAPKLQRLKELHGDDRQKLNQAMMELYKTEKINPLGGCLPIVVQIPVFIALYWVLLASVELRHAPFALWIQDLSAQDPYYVLPVLMGATMFLQTWMSPAPPDPIQAKVMRIMPVAFSIFFFFFPAGLVLYWLVNNILSILQQWQINRTTEHAASAHGKR